MVSRKGKAVLFGPFGGVLRLRERMAIQTVYAKSFALVSAQAGEQKTCAFRFDLVFASMAASDVVLYTYWRSSCSWRARIALQWKGVPYESRFVNLVANGGQQHSSDYIDVNPQKLVRIIRSAPHALTSRFIRFTRPLDPYSAHRRLQVVPVPCHFRVSGRNAPLCRSRSPFTFG